MPAQKRKLSEADVESSCSSNSPKKNRYNSPLYFKPNIQSNTRQSKTTSNDSTSNSTTSSSSTTTNNDYNNKMIRNRLIENTSTQLQLQLPLSQSLPRLPKLSIRRKVNSDSQRSEFTIAASNALLQAAQYDESKTKIVFDRQNSSDDDGNQSSGDDEDEENRENVPVSNLNENQEVESGSSSEEENQVDEEDVEGIDDVSEDEDIMDEIDEDEEEEVEGEENETSDVNSENEDSSRASENTLETESSDLNMATNSHKVVSPIKINLKAFKSSSTGRPSIDETGDEIEHKPIKLKLSKERLKRIVENNGGDDTVKKKRGRPPKLKTEKPKKEPRSITSYYLFCQVTRPKIAEKNPDLSKYQKFSFK